MMMASYYKSTSVVSSCNLFTSTLSNLIKQFHNNPDQQSE